LHEPKRLLALTRSDSQAQAQPRRHSGPPANRDQKSVGGLWDALNDPRRLRQIREKRAPQSTYDACLYELWENGVSQLSQPNCKRRLGDLSTDQVRELTAALLRLKPKYPVTITDTLILKLGDQL
jgi:hypothetical protein